MNKPTRQGSSPHPGPGRVPASLRHELLPAFAAFLLAFAVLFIVAQKDSDEGPAPSSTAPDASQSSQVVNAPAANDSSEIKYHPIARAEAVEQNADQPIEQAPAPKRFHLKLGWVTSMDTDGSIHLGLIDETLQLADVTSTSSVSFTNSSNSISSINSPLSPSSISSPASPNSPEIIDATIAGTGWKGTVNNGNANQGNWSDAGNWDSTPPGSDERNLFFGTAYNTAAGTNFIANNDLVGYVGYRITFESVGSPTAFTLQGNAITLADFGGAQSKIENQSTALQTLNLGITFTASTATFAEINAVNGNLTFGNSATMNFAGTVAGIKMFGSGQTVNFNNTVNGAGKWFAYTSSGGGNIINIGGSFTASDFYVMNGATLNLNSGGNLNSTAIRLGGDFGTTGNQDQTKSGTFQLTNATGGQSFSGTINSVSGNTSAALVVNSLNTSGTNTLSGNIFTDSNLAIVQSSGGTLTISGPVDLKGSATQTLTLRGSGGIINISGVIDDSAGNTGQLVIGTNGTAGTGGTVTLSAANTYSGQTFVRNGTLAYTSTGSTANSTIRLGSSSGASVDATVAFTGAAGGVSIGNTINPVTTSGSGLLTLASQNTSGTNTYSGHIGLDRDFTITQAAGSGTLTISQAHTDGVTAATGYDIKGFNATFTPGAGGTINLTGDIYSSTGTGNLIMNGPGTLILNGVLNAYTGTTTISNGTISANKIVVSSSNSSLGNATSAVILGDASNTGTLSYTGAAAIYVRGFTVNAGGGGLTNAGTGLLQLSTVGTTIASGGTLTFITNANGIQDNSTSVISGSGGIVTLNSAGAGALTLAAQNTYSGNTNLTQGTLALGASSTITAGVLASGPVGIGTFHIGSGTNSANVQTNVTNATVRTINNNISLDGDATFSTSAATGAINFDTKGTLTVANSIALTRTNQLTVNGNVTLTLGGLITGSTFGFTQLGAGTINLGGGTGDAVSNSYNGLTSANGGTLSLNKAAGTNAFGGDLTVNGGTVNYGTAADNQIINSAKVTVSAGTLAFGARTETIGQVATATSGLALSGTGAITIGSGSVIVANSDVMTGGTVTLTAASGSFQANTDFNFSGGTIDFTSVSGTSTAALNIRGGDLTGITYSATGTSTAAITNSGGGTAKLSLNTAANATTVFNIADAPTVSTEMTIATIITGAATNALQKTGAGVLSLSASSTYTGITMIDGGTLVASTFANGGSASSIGQSTSVASNLVFGGGTLQHTAANIASTDRLFTIGDASGLTATIDSSAASTTNIVNFSNTGAIAYGGSGARTLTLTGTNTGNNLFAPFIADSGGFATSLVKNGTGLWILQNATANTYTGGTFVNNGTLQLNGAANATIPGDLTIGDSIGGAQSAIVISVGSQINNTSNVTINNDGLLDLRNNEIIGTLSGSGVVDHTTGGGGLLFTIGQDSPASSSSTFTFSGSIKNTSGTMDVRKFGPGTEILSGTNSWTGQTLVNTGALLINGNSSAVTGLVTVSNSGTIFGGYGTIGGQVNISGGGTPGSGSVLLGGSGLNDANKFGTFTVSNGTTGAITLDSGSVIELALGSSFQHSTIAHTGAGTISFATNEVFTFLDFGATTGTYDNIITGTGLATLNTSGWSISNFGMIGTFSLDAGGNIDLNLTAVPEPTTWVAGALTLVALGYSFVVRRRRKAAILSRDR